MGMMILRREENPSWMTHNTQQHRDVDNSSDCEGLEVLHSTSFTTERRTHWQYCHEILTTDCNIDINVHSQQSSPLCLYSGQSSGLIVTTTDTPIAVPFSTFSPRGDDENGRKELIFWTACGVNDSLVQRKCKDRTTPRLEINSISRYYKNTTLRSNKSKIKCRTTALPSSYR